MKEMEMAELTRHQVAHDARMENALLRIAEAQERMVVTLETLLQRLTVTEVVEVVPPEETV